MQDQRDRTYACVGGTDDDLAAHLVDVRNRCLPLHPTAAETTFRLDCDPSGAVLGLTTGSDGAEHAAPGWLARTTITVLPVEFAVDRDDRWRSCLVAELLDAHGRPRQRIGIAPVDLAHTVHAVRRGRPLRLRAAALATYVLSHPTVEAWRAAEHTAPRGLTAVGLADDAAGVVADPAGVVVTGVVRTADRRFSSRTGRSFAVASVDTGDLVLDVCFAEEVHPALPRPGAVLRAIGRLVSVHAGPVTDLPPRPDAAPDLPEELLQRDPPFTLVRLPGARPWPVPLPVVDLDREHRVVAPMVTASGRTDRGVVACCVDFDSRWQLRRFPPGTAVPDRVADLPGPPESCAVHRDGVAVLTGHDLTVFDAELAVRHRATFPPGGSIAVQPGPGAVHVLVSTPVAPGEAPDRAGEAALRTGAVVHRYGLHRLELVGPEAGTWRSMELSVSGIHRPPGPDGRLPVWSGVAAADSTGAGVWFAVPTVDEYEQPCLAQVVVDAAGRFDRSLLYGPPFVTGRLQHGPHVLTGDAAGAVVDGVRWAGGPAAVTARWLPGPVPAVSLSDVDGRRTRVLEWDPAAGPAPLRMVADLPAHAEVSRAFDERTGARWYALSSWADPGVLGTVTDGGPLHPVLRVQGQAHLLAVHDGTAVVRCTLPQSPLLDLRTGRLVTPGQADTGFTYAMLGSLVAVPLP